MTKLAAAASSLIRGVRLGATVLALFIATDASANVGVTSATEGGPLGKPPADAERILRVGIDVQAGETITTQTDDRVHVVFLDGTSLSVGPNARIVIDKFVYDPNTKTGEMVLGAGAGVFRLIGGRISKSSTIAINTPSATIGIRGGIVMFAVTPVETIASFIFGDKMTVSNANGTQTVTRPESQIKVTTGSAPPAATRVPKGGLAVGMSSLEGHGGGTQTRGQPLLDRTADAKVQGSGFSRVNSDLGPKAGPQLAPNHQVSSHRASFDQGAAGLIQRNTPVVLHAVANTHRARQVPPHR